jgi:hypothetical protein
MAPPEAWSPLWLAQRAAAATLAANFASADLWGPGKLETPD